MSVLFASEAEAQECCARWQKVLWLQDWDVRVHLKRGRDMLGENRTAEVAYIRSKKMAVVNLIDPQDYENRDWPLDHEKSLVHELLHVHFAFSDPLVETNADASRELEIAVDSVARGLTQLWRNSEKRLQQFEKPSSHGLDTVVK